MSFADYADLAPSWLPWGLAHLCGAISALDPWIFHPTLAAAALACLAIKFGPRAIRFWCAAPFPAAAALFAWAAVAAEPAYWILLPLALCPVALWAGSPGRDPMREELVEAAGS